MKRRVLGLQPGSVAAPPDLVSVERMILHYSAAARENAPADLVSLEGMIVNHAAHEQRLAPPWECKIIRSTDTRLVGAFAERLPPW